MTSTFSFHGSLQIASNYWQGKKKLLVIQKYFCSASPRTGDGLWKLELKTASICLAWLGLERSHAVILFELLFLNSFSSMNVEMTEIRSNTPWSGLFFGKDSAVQQAVWLQKMKRMAVLVHKLMECVWTHFALLTSNSLLRPDMHVLALIRSIKAIFGRGCS